MTLPSSYASSRAYLSDCLNFLKSFSWLYNYSNTHILVKRVLLHFPCDWVLYFKNLSYEDLTKLLENNTEADCPNNLKTLLNDVEKLKPDCAVYSKPCKPKSIHNSGLSRKKLHEITSLAPLIDDVCRGNNVDSIIDIGAGLGYLSHLLHDNYKRTVLGVECSAEYVDLAYKNQQKFYPNSKNHVKFAQHYIDSNSSEKIITLLDDYFPNISHGSVCFAGLHACADLSITILDLFAKLEFVKCLVIMPCCYHRIELLETASNEEYFKNFPASRLLKELFKQFEAGGFLTRPFLRLACQQTMQAFKDMTTEQHERHARNCMYRAVLQEVVELENCRVKRLKRKSGKSRASNAEDDFQAYLTNLKTTHELEYNEAAVKKLDIAEDEFQRKMLEKWNEHKDDCHLVEALTGFQASIQGICENIVLLDRVEFLKEKGFGCYVQKVTDDAVSPRCYALIATRR